MQQFLQFLHIQRVGVERLSFFNSIASSNGTVTITATFEPGTNVDQAVFNLNNKVQLALPRLPDEVRRSGVTVQKRSNDILVVVSLVCTIAGSGCSARMRKLARVSAAPTATGLK